MKEEQRIQIKQKIIKLVGQGFTLKDAAKACGINRETIRRWRDKDFAFNAWICARLIQRNLDSLEIDFKDLI